MSVSIWKHEYFFALIMKGITQLRLSLDILFLVRRYYMPGDDHGSYEDPFNTWAMFMNSRNIQIAL